MKKAMDLAKRAMAVSALAALAWDAGVPQAAAATERAAAAAAVAALEAETHTETVDGVAWTFMVADGNAVLGGGRRTVTAVPASTTGNLAVPASLGGHPVAAVGSYAFHDCRGITGITLPGTVVSVGKDVV